MLSEFWAWWKRAGRVHRLSSICTMTVTLLLSVSVASALSDVLECGGAETPCRVDLGDYHAAVPPNWTAEELYPVVLFYHGANGSGKNIGRNRGLAKTMTDRGYVVLAPNGLKMPGRNWTNWALRDGREPWRDELAFTLQMLNDAEPRFRLDRSRVLVSGFSRGASLVWDFACHHPEHFTAYAPIAGGFWRPHPEACQEPVDMHHTHGFQDQVVPLEGRPLRSGRQQGDIFEGLLHWRALNDCPLLRPDRFDMGEAYQCRIWEECGSERQLQLCLHPGGHGLPQGWADRALDWFEERLEAAALEKAKQGG